MYAHTQYTHNTMCSTHAHTLACTHHAHTVHAQNTCVQMTALSTLGACMHIHNTCVNNLHRHLHAHTTHVQVHKKHVLVHARTHTHTRARVHTHTHMHACMHARTHMHMHMHIQMYSFSTPGRQRSEVVHGFLRWSARVGCLRPQAATCGCRWLTWCATRPHPLVTSPA